MRLLEPVHPGHARRALVTILDERPKALVSESAVLSEVAFARDWSRSEEDARGHICSGSGSYHVVVIQHKAAMSSRPLISSQGRDVADDLKVATRLDSRDASPYL